MEGSDTPNEVSIQQLIAESMWTFCFWRISYLLTSFRYSYRKNICVKFGYF